jgi:hypothetical protein
MMARTSGFLNDGSLDAPKLRVYLNLDTLVNLRPDSAWPGLDGLSRYRFLSAEGFEGVQLTNDSAALADAPLPHCGLDRVNTPAEADGVAARHAARGDNCITVHAGWGLEDEAETFRLVEAILAASNRHLLPIFIETHRATITQDVWRTVQIARRFPEVRFNGDFSHYYCGQELVYGNWKEKIDFMEPIFERIGFIHGRIASPGCIQVPIDSDLGAKPRQAHGALNYLDHFKELWIRAMRGFLRSASRGDVLIFAPELLSGAYYYARMFPNADGDLVEESDRYVQSLLIKDLARACFAEAEHSERSERVN